MKINNDLKEAIAIAGIMLGSMAGLTIMIWWFQWISRTFG